VVGLLLPACIAAITGMALRQRPVRYRGVQFAWWGLVVAAFAVELVLYNPPIDSMPLARTYGPWVWVGTRIALLAAVLRNARVRGVWSGACLVMVLGMTLNTAVIVANGGYMPQSPAAAEAVWGPEVVRARVDSGRLQNTRPMDGDSQLTWLGDTLAEPSWLPRPNVLSIGDVVLALGMAGWIFRGLRALHTSYERGDTGAVPDVELREDVLHVRFDGFHRNHELLGDRPI
jgi:Family of unknown function (DUF5317)